jgi:hypothetical protein
LVLDVLVETWLDVYQGTCRRLRRPRLSAVDKSGPNGSRRAASLNDIDKPVHSESIASPIDNQYRYPESVKKKSVCSSCRKSINA